MSNKLVTMLQIRLIIHHLQRGLSGRKIAKELGLSRNTVKLYTDRITGSSFSLDELHKMQDTGLSAELYPTPQKASADSRRQGFSVRTALFSDDLKRTGVSLFGYFFSPFWRHAIRPCLSTFEATKPT